MERKPRIAVILDENTSGDGSRYEASKSYFTAIRDAGGLPFGIPYLPEIVVGRTQLKLHDFRSFLVVSVGTQGDARSRFLPSTPLTLRWIESGFNARQWGKAFGEIPVHGYSASRN